MRATCEGAPNRAPTAAEIYLGPDAGVRWLADHEKVVKWLLRSWPDELRDDLRGVITDRVQGILDTWDESRGVTQGWHVVKNLRWYMWKWVNRRNKESKRAGPMTGETECHRAARERHADPLANKDAAGWYLESLGAYERFVVVTHLLDGVNFEDLGEMLGKSKVSVRHTYVAAMEKMRWAPVHVALARVLREILEET